MFFFAEFMVGQSFKRLTDDTNCLPLQRRDLSRLRLRYTIYRVCGTGKDAIKRVSTRVNTYVLVTGVYIFDKYISVGNGYTKNTGKKNIYYHNNDAPIIDLNSIALLH